MKKQTYVFKNITTGVIRSQSSSLNILVLGGKADIDPDDKARVQLALDNGGEVEGKPRPKLSKPKRRGVK